MALDASTVENIAHLARIEVGKDQLEALAGELSNILGWVEQLAEVDTEGVAPMTSVVDLTMPSRADEVTDGDCRDQVLANAAEPVDGFFAVPKVIE